MGSEMCIRDSRSEQVHVHSEQRQRGQYDNMIVAVIEPALLVGDRRGCEQRRHVINLSLIDADVRL